MYHISNDKRSRQSAGWIYEALAALIPTQPYNTITVSAVAAKAQLGRATFYRNFDSLDDVLQMKCDGEFQQLYDYLLQNYQHSFQRAEITGPPFLRFFLHYWYQHPAIIRVLIAAGKTDIIKSSFNQLLTSFLRLIDDSYRLVQPYTAYFSALYSGIALNVLLQWIGDQQKETPDELAEIIIRLMKVSLNSNLLI